MEFKRGALELQTTLLLLRRGLQDHMRKHKQCYGRSGLLPKHHWMFDVIEQLAQDGFLADCFIVERLHLRVKCHAELTKNTTDYERSVLIRQTAAHVALTAAGGFGSLCGPRGRVPAHPSIIWADRLERLSCVQPEFCFYFDFGLNSLALFGPFECN